MNKLRISINELNNNHRSTQYCRQSNEPDVFFLEKKIECSMKREKLSL